MSIQVSGLTKLYGKQRAVNNVSFTVTKGEIVGFLGPNGAGKSTTMKIITGYLPPTDGSVTVAGRDVTVDPMFVKRCTGYLGEHNPLYHDMYVHEYLGFVAAIYGIRSAEQKKRLQAIIEKCGLDQEQNKKIGALSKGYRQRIGLAQALIHDPAVLVLDEPTSGLDPNQLVEIRKLIKAISADKTVLFSSHILQEVEALCDRVIVINNGSIVADDRLEHLMRNGNRFLIVEFEKAIDESALTRIAGVESVTRLEGQRFRITAKGENDVRPSVVAFAAQQHLSLVEIRMEENSLETVFSQLTRDGNNLG